jgi:hypothetical protein
MAAHRKASDDNYILLPHCSQVVSSNLIPSAAQWFFGYVIVPKDGLRSLHRLRNRLKFLGMSWLFERFRQPVSIDLLIIFVCCAVAEQIKTIHSGL